MVAADPWLSLKDPSLMAHAVPTLIAQRSWSVSGSLPMKLSTSIPEFASIDHSVFGEDTTSSGSVVAGII